MLTALRSGLADAVIVVGRDANRPWVPAARTTDSEDEVIRCGQTSYCLTPNLQLLRDPRYKRVALVGVPCEVQAVRKMQNLVPLPEVAEKVVLAVEIACASSTKLAGTEFLITEKLGIPLRDVTEMRYRQAQTPRIHRNDAMANNDRRRFSRSSTSSNVTRRTAVWSAQTGGPVSPTSPFPMAIPTSMRAVRAERSRLGSPS